MQSSRSSRDRRLIYGIEVEKEFTNGFILGLGIGLVAIFIISWASVFFLSAISGIDYGNLLSVFIYPMFFMLGSGISLIVTGFIRESNS